MKRAEISLGALLGMLFIRNLLAGTDFGLTGDLDQGGGFYLTFEKEMAQKIENENRRPSILVELQNTPVIGEDLLGRSGQPPESPPILISPAISKENHIPPPVDFYPPKVTLGVVGGMGPIAGASYLNQLIKHLKLNLTDEELLDVQIKLYSDPALTSVYGLWKGGLLNSFKGIKGFFRSPQIDFFNVACNTAHQYADYYQSLSEGRLLSIIQAVTDHVKETLASEKVALLATNVTVKKNLYTHEFADRGMKLILPGKPLQEKVQAGILLVKQGKLQEGKKLFLEVISTMQASEGVSAFILGCTEIPVVISEDDFREQSPGITLVDSAEILAMATVKAIKEKLRQK